MPAPAISCIFDFWFFWWCFCPERPWLPVTSHIVEKVVSYFTGSHDSRSNPLWMDWAMEDSIRSTYRTTRGAYRSCRCLWNFPLHRWSVKTGENTKFLRSTNFEKNIPNFYIIIAILTRIIILLLSELLTNGAFPLCGTTRLALLIHCS